MRTDRPIAVALLLSLNLLWAGCSSKGSAPSARTRPPPLVSVAKVEARDVPVTLNAPVDLRPLFSADVGAKTLGYLDAVLVDRGDRVRKGQLLAVVRPSDLPDQLAAERGSLGTIKAAAALARSNFERAEKLAPSGLVSQQDLQTATSALAQAEASEHSSESRISALATRLGEMRIEAPLDGVVASRRLDPGALVGPGAAGPILTVVQTNVLRVFIAITEREIGRAKLGQEARVDLDAFPGRSFQGRLVRLAPAFDSSTRTIDAEVQLENTTGELRPGMYGRGAIVVETHAGAPVIPATAAVINSKGQFAFVLSGEGVRRVPIELGVDGGEWLEVLRGLKVGDEVVVAGTDGLADGARVRVYHPSSVPAPAQGPAAAAASPRPGEKPDAAPSARN